jgi:hypothetical protein
MVVADIQNLAGTTARNKAFIAFEKRAAGQNGVYFKEFDLSQGVADPDTILDTAVRIVPGADYGNLDLQRISLYSNEEGSDVTVTIITGPSAGQSRMLTGRVVNHQYISCAQPTTIQGQFRSLFGFYFKNNTKLKIWTGLNSQNQAIGGAEGH